MSDIGGEACRSHAAATNGEDHIGDQDGTSLTLREACNKIIHAVDFRPIYDHSDRRISEGEYRRVWFMTGEIEIGGMKGREQWAAVLYVPPFLEIVIDRLAFALPDPEPVQT
nr:hypothetical protein [uncultured Brevundimonas sp.]